jgi:DNA-binding transcriptional regulator YiaG
MKPSTRKTTFEIHLPATKDAPPEFLETVEVEVFEQFGEEFLTPESSKRIEQIKARHMGLMTGKDIKAMRERLGLTQKQLTSLLECGEKSLSRWENGHGYPTGIVNKMLRLLDEGRISLADLKAVEKKPLPQRLHQSPAENRDRPGSQNLRFSPRPSRSVL